MKPVNRRRWFAAIALGAIVLITLIAAPNANQFNAGSTYNRAPDGYGAWYAFMQQQGTPVQRWQKPFGNLETLKRPITLLRVNSNLSPVGLNKQEQDWVKQGNTLVILGVRQPVTAAAFRTMQPSAVGRVKIATRRRHWQRRGNRVFLGDRFGAVVWQEKLGKGQVIFATTPDLAANAYQDDLNNYTFLAQLLSQHQNPIWVDEYIHGYKDSTLRDTEAEQNWISYLVQTPLFPALLQISIFLLVLIWAENRRFGASVVINPPTVDNSQAYIQALAGVLQKAECTDFVVDEVSKAEQMQLQKVLGLGVVPLDHQTLIDAWVEKTGRSAVELKQVLRSPSQKRRMSDKDLLLWLQQWQTIRRHIAS